MTAENPNTTEGAAARGEELNFAHAEFGGGIANAEQRVLAEEFLPLLVKTGLQK